MTDERKEMPWLNLDVYLGGVSPNVGVVVPTEQAKALWEGASFLIKLSQRIKDGRASTQETGLCVIEIADALLKKGIGL